MAGRTHLGRASATVRRDARRQWADVRPTVLLLLGITVLVFGGLVVLRATTGVAIATFTRDPLGYTAYPWYKGAVSNLGVIVWSGAAAVCVFGWALGSRAARRTEQGRFLRAGGLLTTVLLLDDLYMLHEVVFPEQLGITENLVYAAYGLILATFVVRFRSMITQADPLLLLGAMGGLGFSTLLDVVAGYVPVPGYHVLEDGGKFFGILCWAGFFARSAARHLRTAAGAGRSPSIHQTDRLG